MKKSKRQNPANQMPLIGQNIPFGSMPIGVMNPMNAMNPMLVMQPNKGLNPMMGGIPPPPMGSGMMNIPSMGNQ